MKYKYQLFFPVGQRMLDYIMGEQSKDVTYECVYTGAIDVGDGGADFSDALELLWQRHNEGDFLDGDRPRRHEIRSMCIGDIIYLHDEQQAFIVAPVGFTAIDGEDMTNIGDLLEV